MSPQVALCSGASGAVNGDRLKLFAWRLSKAERWASTTRERQKLMEDNSLNGALVRVEAALVVLGLSGMIMEVCAEPQGSNVPAGNHAFRPIMSALPPKADMCSATSHVCFGPGADMCSATSHVRFGPKADIATKPELLI